MKDKIINSMQKFAKAMIGPVLFLPIVGMSIALTAVFTNTAFVTEKGVIWTIGKFFNGMLSPIMGNLSILFCVGIAMGMAKKKKAEAAFVSIMSYILFLGANSKWLELSGKIVKGDTAGALYGTGQTIQLGFHVTDMGVFLGMILGVLVAVVHNKYVTKEFKGAMAPYGNSKLVFVVMIPIIAVFSIVITYVWPTIAGGISALTGFMNTAGPIGVFVYGFLNRFLVPTGLHHLIWSPFLYSSVGDQMMIGGQNVIGAKPVFLALLGDPSVTMMRDSARFLTYGLVKTFGVIGVALAFYFTAKKSKRNNLKAQLIPSTLTAVIAGITEPLEFTFIFAAPLLWFVYSVIDGLFQMFVYLLNVRVCATNGILDFLVINLPAGISKTHWPLYVLVGLVEIVVLFFVFKIMIEKLDLKTPGREDDDTDMAVDLTENAAAVKMQMKSASKNDEEAEDREKALTIIKALGGKNNILTVDNCFSRLRVEVADNTLIDEKTLKATGASGVVRKGNNIQVVYGLTINKIRTIVDEALETMETLK
ncbi:PTS transporter subunit EIIC [Clostridium folliculivorans]|uniref:PTS system, glucose/glucoside family, IIBC component n=1 Tax=Clostridium folliculivorans TaxID=2886038 RepID=A0A9W5Y234_9CLOT|nr:PTS transporter subunit EIIC [Clostridium folliculivorans]GKU25159.1 PTS system, glucose/glucoside family, IIBC component [Clostridium folliculivorans]GKU31257.1 PTS system, glucose/glucoside family, IIBC component [Clostridium folliculivorans]